MKVYLTKYALTAGIIEAEVERRGDAGHFVTLKNKVAMNGSVLVRAKEVFDSLDEALADFQRRKMNRIRQLEAQVKKLKAATPKLAVWEAK